VPWRRANLPARSGVRPRVEVDYETDSEALLARYTDTGDVGAFSRLYDSFGQRLFATGVQFFRHRYGYEGARAMASDAAHETWARIIRRKDHWGGSPGSFDPWVIAIHHHCLLEMVRDVPACDDIADDERDAPAADLERRVLSREALERERLLYALPPAMKPVVLEVARREWAREHRESTRPSPQGAQSLPHGERREDSTERGTAAPRKRRAWWRPWRTSILAEADPAIEDLPGAAAEVLKRLGPKVLEYLGSVLRDDGSVEEAFSSFAETLWNDIPLAPNGPSLDAWALRIAWNAAMTVVERKPHEKRIGTREAKEIDVLPPEQRQLEMLREALTAEERSVLHLRVGKGLSWKEIAAIHGARPRGIKKGFEALKKRLLRMARDAGMLK
jgi:RNA polymerase sigma-70 factor, ECF subfamily